MLYSLCCMKFVFLFMLRKSVLCLLYFLCCMKLSFFNFYFPLFWNVLYKYMCVLYACSMMCCITCVVKRVRTICVVKILIIIMMCCIAVLYCCLYFPCYIFHVVLLCYIFLVIFLCFIFRMWNFCAIFMYYILVFFSVLYFLCYISTCVILVLYFCVIFFVLYFRVWKFHVVFSCYIFCVIFPHVGFSCCIFVLYFCVVLYKLNACRIAFLFYCNYLAFIYLLLCVVLYSTWLSSLFFFSVRLKLFLIYSNFLVCWNS